MQLGQLGKRDRSHGVERRCILAKLTSGSGERLGNARPQCVFEHRQHPVAHPHAQKTVVLVLRIVPNIDAAVGTKRLGGLATQFEHRAQVDLANRAHARQRLCPRASRQPKQHGLGLIVEGVPQHHKPCAALLAGLLQRGVAGGVGRMRPHHAPAQGGLEHERSTGAAFAVDDGPVELWTPGQPVPPTIVAHAASGGPIAAWNANFEIAIWTHILGPRYGWPLPRLEQWRCSMVAAYAMSLPGALENATGAIGLDIGKDQSGKRLMLTMASPRRPRKGEPDGLYWWDDAERRERLYAYCKTDVEVERGIRARLVSLRASEQHLWHLDQRVNARGVYVDKALCLKAKDLVAHVASQLNREMAIATDWAVTACSNINDLKTFVRGHGVDTDALDREAIEELLARKDIPEAVRRPLELRHEAGKASVAKINALLHGLSDDGRARGMMQFHAASTGRWAGRRIQPHNMPRPAKGLKLKHIEDAIANFRAHTEHRLAQAAGRERYYESYDLRVARVERHVAFRAQS